MALWIVATPIGTLDDLSPRAREVIAGADLVLSEDTRTTRKLLHALGVEVPRLEAVHVKNEAARAEGLAARARDAEVALVTDAGTPGVSDPGGHVVAAALALGVEVRSVPGPSALAAALAASGLPAAPTTFLGFPPRKGRAGWARDALAHTGTLVMFEGPGRVPGLVADLAAATPGREGVLCRELSKKFEEVRRAPLAELADALAGTTVRGECVVLVGPGPPPPAPAPTTPAPGLKGVAETLAEDWGVKKRDVYNGLIALKDTLVGDPTD